MTQRVITLLYHDVFNGVDPDIEVDNDPAEVIKGRDQQLEKAVDVLLEKIEQEPRSLPARPAPPPSPSASRVFPAPRCAVPAPPRSTSS